MRVGFLGLGRLGLPIAAVLSQNHRVTGYDPDPSTAERLKVGHGWEVGLGEYLNDRIALAPSIDAATYDAEAIVVCVQTPHVKELDGTHDTDRRAPFDLYYVVNALAEVSSTAPIILMSTVLPGDCRKLDKLCQGPLIYAPAFPAMGTTVPDFLNPEFVLLGTDTGADGEMDAAWDLLENVVTTDSWFHAAWETAELTKMAYNTAIGTKLALANTVGWLADEVNADGGKVMEILATANRRITSEAYFRPGLGDGGACHPRDQIALSWMAQKHGVYDFFSNIIDQRSAHSEWVASVARLAAKTANLERVVILGAAYKADSTLTDGSPALLLANQTGWEIVESSPTEPCVIVVGVPHTEYATLDLSKHVVVDPWGICEGAVQVGRRPG